jgi:ParB-like chromosome segregation protein Spo0J
VFWDGEYYWPADGFHRLIAAEELGLVEISADVRAGIRPDAVIPSKKSPSQG